MRLLGNLVLVGCALLIFESDQMSDMEMPFLKFAIESWQGAVKAVGYEELRNGLRQGFWQWLDEAWVVQEEIPPPVPKVSEVPVFSVQRPLRVLVLGDSLAGFYLPNALGQLARLDGRVEVESLYRVAASLANPARMDFNVEVPRFWEQRQRQTGRGFDIVVVLMGANDRQAIRHQGSWLRFNTEPWRREYLLRLSTLLDYVSTRSHQVYWLQLPPMREASLEQEIRMIEEMIKPVLANFHNVRFLDQRHLLSLRGEYTPVGVVDGVQVPLRARDGIHLSTHGARILAQDIWYRMFRDFAFEPIPDPTRSRDPPENPPASESPERVSNHR